MAMGRGSLIIVLALILLFALFGWRTLGILVVLLLLIPTLLVVGAFVLVWWFKRRMKKAAKHFEQAILGAAQREARMPPVPGRDDAIDVEGRVKGPPT